MAGQREKLLRIEGYSGSESQGKAFGLDGNQYLPILISLIISIVMAGLMVITRGNISISSGFLVATPFLLTFAYILLFVFHKPPEYRRDFFEKLVLGKDYYTNRPRYSSPLYSLLEANRKIKKVSQVHSTINT